MFYLPVSLRENVFTTAPQCLSLSFFALISWIGCYKEHVQDTVCTQMMKPKLMRMQTLLILSDLLGFLSSQEIVNGP